MQQGDIMKLQDIKPTVAKFYLQHPVTLEKIKDENEKEVFWNVVGQDSSQYYDAQQEFLKHLEKLGDKAKELKPVDYRKYAVTQLSKLVVGWDKEFDTFHDGGFTQKKLESLLGSADYGWMYNQLDSFVAKRRNFFVA